MRILHLGDLHLRFSGPRAAECRRILDYVGEHAADAMLDAVIIAGDVFDTRSTPAERLYLASWLSALADVAVAETVKEVIPHPLNSAVLKAGKPWVLAKAPECQAKIG